MKYFKLIILVSLFGLLYSCGGDDDICESGEGTPRMKVAFKNSDNKIITLDSLHLQVDYGSGKVDLGWKTKAESVLIPLRVDDSQYTDVYVKTKMNGNEAQLKINYTTKTFYVSPGCGIKKTYDNLNPELVTPNPVQNLELGQNFIENEDKTNLYLLF